MRAATAYATDAPVATMQQAFVENVESETNEEITTELYPAGQLSVGSELASKVQGGSVEVGSVSLSNFSPYAPAVDVINLPYFAADFQQFVNLITSDTWERLVYDKVRQNGYEPLFIWMGAGRELGLGKGMNRTITSPGDVEGLKIRIPSSDYSQKAWSLIDANPTPVGWGETAQAVEEGVVDAVHVSAPPLAAYGFGELLGDVTGVKMFMDCGIYAMSKKWFDGLSSEKQDQIKTAADQTFKQHLSEVIPTLNKAEQILTEGGANMRDLSDSEVDEWKEALGYQRSEWDKEKKELAGSLDEFKELEAARESNNGYTVEGV
jgi:TRAP-type C4-dicarboxylate transport system substrate-binding protein